jgi:cytochrome c-type biogenesis protein CcmE
MKKIHIIGLLVIAAAIGILITMAGDYSTYSDFSVVDNRPDEVHQVVGHLVLEEAKPIVYDPAVDPNYFSFYMKDKKGVQKQIVFKGAKPQDFERSEQIVLTGKMEGDVFVAADILLKCPSKYKDNQKFSAT